jgi:hypothetical protein
MHKHWVRQYKSQLHIGLDYYGDDCRLNLGDFFTFQNLHRNGIVAVKLYEVSILYLFIPFGWEDKSIEGLLG